MAAHGGAPFNIVRHTPDQLTINDYDPGAGIPAHADTHSAFYDGIVVVSLLSPVVMEFHQPTSGAAVGYISLSIPRALSFL